MVLCCLVDLKDHLVQLLLEVLQIRWVLEVQVPLPDQGYHLVLAVHFLLLSQYCLVVLGSLQLQQDQVILLVLLDQQTLKLQYFQKVPEVLDLLVVLKVLMDPRVQPDLVVLDSLDVLDFQDYLQVQGLLESRPVQHLLSVQDYLLVLLVQIDH